MRACRYFEGSNVMIRTDGVKLLGCPIGTEAFMESQFKSKFENWTADLDLESQPQAAYAAFVYSDGLNFLDPALSQLIISIV